MTQLSSPHAVVTQPTFIPNFLINSLHT